MNSLLGATETEINGSTGIVNVHPRLPIQAGAAIALGFGLNLSAVAAQLNIHRSTLHNWIKNPVFVKAAQTCQAEFEKQFRTQLAILTRLALNNIREILTNPDASPSVRLKAALAVLKQDWKLPESTEFDTNSQESESVRNEMPPESPEPPQPIRSEKIGRNEPCPCGSTLKYKRCCGNPVRPPSTNFDSAPSVESITCETN